jgi:hypothetical protein
MLADILHHPQQLIGLSEKDAKKMISENNFTWQVVSRDGCKVSHYKNIDFRRFSLIIDDETVINAYLG